MDISAFLNNKYIQIGGAAVVSFSAGYVIGQLIGKKQAEVTIVEPEPDVKVDEMVAALADRSDFDEGAQRLLKAVITGHPSVVVDLAALSPDAEVALLPDRPLLSKDDVPSEEVVVEIEKITKNVFEGGEYTEWDYGIEIAHRTPEAPYIISVDEFFGEEKGYRQSNATYYRGDDILADEQDTPIYGHDRLLGELRFGHGSNDKNVVYVRNEQTQQEWEVILHTGKFEEEVMGLSQDREIEAELRHSERNMRFRGE